MYTLSFLSKLSNDITNGLLSPEKRIFNKHQQATLRTITPYTPCPLHRYMPYRAPIRLTTVKVKETADFLILRFPGAALSPI